MMAPRRATARIARAETDQEPATQDEQQCAPVSDERPRKQLGRVLAGRWMPISPSAPAASLSAMGASVERRWPQTRHEHASGKHKIPRFRLPVVLQEVEVVGDARRAHVAERRADSKRSVQQDEVQRHHQSNDGSSHVPRPRLTDPFDNAFMVAKVPPALEMTEPPKSHSVSPPSRRRPGPKCVW